MSHWFWMKNHRVIDIYRAIIFIEYLRTQFNFEIMTIQPICNFFRHNKICCHKNIWFRNNIFLQYCYFPFLRTRVKRLIMVYVMKILRNFCSFGRAIYLRSELISTLISADRWFGYTKIKRIYLLWQRFHKHNENRFK